MRLCAVVLAAGAGTRLGGVAKALLHTATGETYLEAIVRTARAVGVSDIVVVVGAPFGDDVTTEAVRLGARLVVNPDPARGMASSIALGFAALTGGDAAFLWPVDHSHVRVDTLSKLIAALGDTAVKPRYEGRGGHPPLVAAARWPALAACGDALDGARGVLRDAIDVAVDDPGVVRDVDTPEDLACAR